MNDHHTVPALLRSAHVLSGPSGVDPELDPVATTPSVRGIACAQLSLGCPVGQIFGRQKPLCVHVFPEGQLACVTSVQEPVKGVQQDPVGCAHGLGEQTPPCVQVLPEAQFAWVTEVQPPVVGLQHEPEGCAHGFGEHTPEAVQALPEAQFACVTTVHAPVVGLQHEPVGSGQGLGVHAPARQVPEHPAWTRNVHAPAALQQAPGHGFGLQTVPEPWKVSGLAQPVGTVVEQTAVPPSQQAPVHGFGEQMVPPAVKLPLHAAGVVIEHAPVVVLQHSPEQGLGVHEPPLKTLDAAWHAADVTNVQTLLELQHAPWHGPVEHVPAIHVPPLHAA